MASSEARTGLLDFVERAGQGLFGNLRVVAEGQQDLALAFEFLDQVELEVGAAGHFKDLEQGDEGDMVFEGAFRRTKCGPFRTGLRAVAACGSSR
jgi:hypothetical protein